MGVLRNLITRWRTPRDWPAADPDDLSRAVLHTIGRNGYALSGSYDVIADGQKAYGESFDPRLPPSLFVSERDRTRSGMAMPLVERCIEDHGSNVAAAKAEHASERPHPPRAND